MTRFLSEAGCLTKKAQTGVQYGSLLSAPLGPPQIISHTLVFVFIEMGYASYIQISCRARKLV